MGSDMMVTGMPRLEKLNLANNNLGRDGAHVLAAGLAAVSASLVELDFSENGTEAAGVDAITAAPLRLKVLSLRKNWPAAQADADSMKRLLQCLQDSLVSLEYMGTSYSFEAV